MDKTSIKGNNRAIRALKTRPISNNTDKKTIITFQDHLGGGEKPKYKRDFREGHYILLSFIKKMIKVTSFKINYKKNKLGTGYD